MTKLEKKLQQDYASISRSKDAMITFYSNDVGKMIDQASKDVIANIAAVLSMQPQPITFMELRRGQTFDRLSSSIKHRYDNLASELEHYWGEKRENFDLLSRLASNFIARKASPPWVNTKLNLKDKLSTDGKFDPRMGHFRYQLGNMAEAIVKQIKLGSLKQESLNQIMNRVRKMFDRKDKNNVREEDRPDLRKLMFDSSDDSLKQNISGVITADEGVFTLEDIDRLSEDYISSNTLAHREYKPWFSDSLKANNRYLRQLEQDLYSDANYLVSEGLMQVGSKEMGIKDLQWVVKRPGVCECCDKRSGMTMNEIKAKIKDEYGGQPPPLHPHCNCELVPKISDDWADNELSKAGMDWDPNDGLVYKADKQERGFGISNMNFLQYIDSVGR